MRSEEDCPPRVRYLCIASQLSSARLAMTEQKIREWLKSARDLLTPDALDVANGYLESRSEPTHRTFIVTSVYADVPAGRTYDLIFDFGDHRRTELREAHLLYGVSWERPPLRGLDHGHHQLARFDFPKGAPSLVEELPCDVNDGVCRSRLGLCDANNWMVIRHGLEKLAVVSAGPTG